MKRHKNVSPGQFKLVQDYVKKCMRHLRKKQYELDLPTDCWKTALDVLEVKKRKNTPSKAGANLIMINLGYWQFGNKYHTEYKAFNNHPTIGEIEVNDDYDHLLIMIAHEVSHHVQYRYCPRVARFKTSYRKPHGECFKAVYDYLRRDLVNPIIENKRK